MIQKLAVDASAREAWPRAVGLRALRPMPIGLRRRLFYLTRFRRIPNFRRPARFSEKVNWRILYDRRAVLRPTCDKLAMKDLAARCNLARLNIPETVWAGSDVTALRRVPLPDRWVLKPNHGSHQVLFGVGSPDVADLQARTRHWLEEARSALLGEWAYGLAARQFVVEPFLGTDNTPPPDYKIFVFSGQPALIQVDTGRFSRHRRRLYTPDWEPLDVVNAFPLADVEERPSALADMLEAAAVIAEPYDFMRVDLYWTGGQLFFGEITPYPGSGLEPFTPERFDHWLGARWQLPGASC